MHEQLDNLTRGHLKTNMAFGPEQQQEKPVYIGDHPIEEDYLIVYVDVSINVVFAINLDSVARFPIQLKYEECNGQL
ncbi:hypothetical protein, partial [Moritella viscosa]|uniref:hypothetical protein n=1 Tax=Moritella viscosa TaxID=80854 RepID=UPI0009243B95